MTFQERITDFALKHGIRYDEIERQRTIWFLVPDVPAGVQQNIYFPFDKELKDSIITGIRAYPADDNPATVPATIENVQVADNQVFSSFAMTIANKKGKLIIKDLPCYTLLSTTNINVQEEMKFMFRWYPEKSYITFFDITNGVSSCILPLVFTYHKVIK